MNVVLEVWVNMAGVLGCAAGLGVFLELVGGDERDRGVTWRGLLIGFAAIGLWPITLILVVVAGIASATGSKRIETGE